MRTEEKLNLIVELTHLLRKKEMPTDIFAEIGNIARDITESDRCSLYLFDDKKELLFTKIAQGVAQTIEVKLGQGIAGKVAETGQMILENDVYGNKAFEPSIDTQTGYRTEKMLAVPIFGNFEHRLLGVLQVLNKLEGDFTPGDGEMLHIVGDLAASIVEYHSIRVFLEEKVREKTIELQELNDTLQQQVEEKVRENREKDKIMFQQSKNAAMGEMISMITHQWRQPISAISAVASKVKLQAQMGKETSADEDMGRIIDSTRYLSQTIEDFRNFFRPDTQKEASNLGELAKSALRYCAYAIEMGQIEVQTDFKEVVISVYPNEIIQVLINLIKNAIDQYKANSDAKKVVMIDVFVRNSFAAVAIKDRAGGVPEEVLPYIFQEYFTTKDLENGTGLGLHMSRMIVENHHSGTIAIRNEEDGAVFEILLPFDGAPHQKTYKTS